MLLRNLSMACAVVASFAVSVAGAQAESAAQRPAKVMFGMTSTPAPMAARAIGSYSRGCLAGGVQLPVDGDAWQAMRLSRNRNWGTPQLVRYVETLAKEARAKDGWPGLLVGDLAQPRGGPMLTGHASHQIGLDADIWLTPMPDRKLSHSERENKSAISMLAADGVSVDPAIWTLAHAKVIRRAATTRNVARIFVHPAIKKALCDMADEVDPKDRSWLRVVRPWYGHHYHFHVRLDCPPGMAGCVDQPALPVGDGCGKDVDDWLARLRPKPVDPTAPKPKVTAKPKKKLPLTLAQLPPACATVLAAGYADGLKRFKLDIADFDIEAPARNPRRMAQAGIAGANLSGVAVTPVAAPADAGDEPPAAVPAQVVPAAEATAAPAPVIAAPPSMGFSGGFAAQAPAGQTPAAGQQPAAAVQ